MPTYFLLSGAGVAGIVIAALVVAIGLFFLFYVFYKKRFRSASSNLRKTYDTYHLQLTSDCQNMVNRLKTLGANNSYFNSMYLERQKQYDDIVNKRDKDVATALDSLNDLIKEKNYKEYKKAERETADAIKDFSIAVCNFNSDLTSILQDDNDIHSNAVIAKSKYRDIHSFYEEHKIELSPLEKPFEKIFSTSEEKFDLFDKYSDEANFEEAKKILSSLEKLFDAVNNVLADLPSLEVSVSTVIPQKLNSLMEEYQKMVKDGFIVSEMHVEDKVKAMREKIASIQSQLMVLDIRNAKEKISQIQSQITDILAGFEEERKAKDIYFSRQNSLADSSFSVEKRYARMMNQLPLYQKSFVLDDKYVSQMKSLKIDIENIGILKRELDSYLDTSAKQPYVVITRKITDMDNEMTKVIQVMDDYSNYLKSLKEDSSQVFYGIRDCFTQLKKAQNTVNQLGVSSYTNSVKDVFTKDFETIKHIYGIVTSQPIDVPKAKSEFFPFKEEVTGFVHSVEATKEEANKAEAAIVYANAYRRGYSDARPLLAQAESSFLEGDFARATYIALNVVKTFSGSSVSE